MKYNMDMDLVDPAYSPRRHRSVTPSDTDSEIAAYRPSKGGKATRARGKALKAKSKVTKQTQRKGPRVPWTKEEDELLLATIDEHLSQTGKSSGDNCEWPTVADMMSKALGYEGMLVLQCGMPMPVPPSSIL